MQNNTPYSELRRAPASLIERGRLARIHAVADSVNVLGGATARARRELELSARAIEAATLNRVAALPVVTPAYEQTAAQLVAVEPTTLTESPRAEQLQTAAMAEPVVNEPIIEMAEILTEEEARLAFMRAAEQAVSDSYGLAA